VNLHNTGVGPSVLQFRRSRVPGIRVELSGVRVNAASVPGKLNNKFTFHRKAAQRCVLFMGYSY